MTTHSTNTPGGPDYLSTDAAAHGAAPAAHAHADYVFPKAAIVHIVIGLVFTFSGLFTMMTVVYSAYGATIAMLGAGYTALMLPLSLRDGR